MKDKTISNLLFVFAVSVFLLVPMILTNTKLEQTSEAENRMLADPVPFSYGLTAYMESLETCANDRIGLREGMVRLYNSLTVNLLQTRNDRVIFGEDGWLFFAEDLPDYTGQTNTPENVEYCVQVLKALDAWCAERGGQLIFMVGPNKTSVYSQYMPDYYRKAEVSLLDALSARMAEEDILFVNPKERLIADADKVELYQKLDTHWNAHGAKYALDDLLDQLSLPQKAIPVDDYRVNTGDMLSMLMVEHAQSDSLMAEVPVNPACTIEQISDVKHMVLHCGENSSFVCYRDSFSTALVEYYTHYFRGPVFWNWNVLQTPEEDFPAYVLVECVERLLLPAMDSCASVLG